MEVEYNDLFAIEVSSDTEDTEEKKQPRDYQSEEAFEEILASYKPKTEGVKACSLHKTTPPHLPPPSNGPQDTSSSKQAFQSILHAIEELYFHHRYSEAEEFAKKVLDSDGVGEEWKGVLEGYRDRCAMRRKGSVAGSR